MAYSLCRFIARCLVASLLLVPVAVTISAQEPAPPRPRIGVAFGGGSARGFAHVGVIRWFEEHRIPIDVVAGTSMGGLIGGAFASGMSSAELRELLAKTNWNEMFGNSNFRYRNIRRKLDARAYPSRLEFGLKRGLALPAALNNGQEVDFLLSRMAAAYGELRSFDDLPTPFRSVAVDLRTATQVILDHGSLPVALRATMSLPGVFPPVEADGRVLVDGGAMNNVPADVVRGMGADVVIAVNVGSMAETRDVSSSLLGIAGSTIDAMMLASTRRGMAAATLVINPQLEGFGSLDWRRADDMADRGYEAAESMKAELLKYAVDQEAWQRYVAARDSRRRTTLPVMTSLTVIGAARQDEELIRKVLTPRVGQPVTAADLEADLQLLSGLDRYETLGWGVIDNAGTPGLVIRARPKAYGPPFLMLSTNLQNTTNDDFSFQLAGRYLTYDKVGFGSELRLDAAAGSSSNIAAELYRPIGHFPVFAAASAGIGGRRLNFVQDDAIIAQYSQTRGFVGADLGVNLGRDSEVRLGVRSERIDAAPKVGNPMLPSVEGEQTIARLRWVYDGQDSPVVPSHGSRFTGTIRHIFNAPEPVTSSFATTVSNDNLTQTEIEGSMFTPIKSQRDRVFLTGGAGASFGADPLPTEQYELGYPLRLGAFNVGEHRGNHYVAFSAGYLRGVARLPDFLGGSVYAGGWLENGSAFNNSSDFEWSTHVGLGAIVETLIGPALVGMNFSFDGQTRYYIAIGRLF